MPSPDNEQAISPRKENSHLERVANQEGFGGWIETPNLDRQEY